MDFDEVDRGNHRGAVIVWSGGQPRCAVHRIDHKARRLDRSLVPWDPAIDLDIDLDTIGTNRVTDRGCGLTYARRQVSSIALSPPFVVSTTGSVLVMVYDVRPFENVTPARDGNLVIAGSLASLVRSLDQAANAEEHVSIKGPPAISRELAIRYAAKLGAYAWFRPSGDQHLDHLLATRPNVRTIIIDLSRPLFDFDISTINRVLETDLRFVVVRSTDHYVQWLPAALAFPPLLVPDFRPDELAFAIYDELKKHSDEATIETAVVARLVDHAHRHGEDAFIAALAVTLGNWRATERSQVRARDLARDVT